MGESGTYTGAAASRIDENDDGSNWGAADSLRRLGLDSATEQTPLLGNGGAAEETRRTPEWEGEADFEGVKWWRKPSVTWLLPPFFLFALAAGGIIVPKNALILSLVCRDYLIEKSLGDPNYVLTPVLLGGNNPQCRIPEVQALVTEFTLTLTIIIGVLSAIVAPKLGSLSDQYGRTKILLISSLGAFCTEIMTIVIASYPDEFNYRWLLVGAIFDGICGSFTTGMAISYAYATDCTAPPRRAEAFGYFHACLFGGIALGPLLAAYLYRYTHELLAVFYVALGIHIFFMVCIFSIVPESLSEKRQLAAREKLAAARDAGSLHNPGWLRSIQQANLLEPLKVLYPTGPGSSPKLRANLVLLAGVDTIMFGVAMGAVNVVIFYTIFQFDWQTDDTAIFISVVNIFRVTGLIVLLPSLNYIFRTRPANRQRRKSGFATPQPNSGSDTLDLYAIRFAIMMEFIGYLGYALARTGSLFAVSGIVTAFGGIGSPTLQSSLTKHVPLDRVGSLLGATGLLHALTRVVCPLIFNMIYAKTVGKYTQAVFVVLASCFGVAFFFSWFIRPHVYLEELDTVDSAAEVPARTNESPDALLDEELIGI